MPIADELIKGLLKTALTASLQVQTLRIVLAEKGLLSHEEFDAVFQRVEGAFQKTINSLVEDDLDRKIRQVLEEYKGTVQ